MAKPGYDFQAPWVPQCKSMIEFLTHDMPISKSLLCQTTPLLTLQPIHPNPDHCLYLLNYLIHLLFVFECHQPLLKPNDNNGEGNSLKRNSLKIHQREHKKTPSLLNRAVSNIDSMNQQV